MSPEPAPTSSNESWRLPLTLATRSISFEKVLAPPNQRLIIRRSASEPAISPALPALESSSSGTTVRFIGIGKQARIRSSAGWRLHLRQLFFQQLFVVEVGVVSVARQQFVVASQLDNASAV